MATSSRRSAAKAADGNGTGAAGGAEGSVLDHLDRAAAAYRAEHDDLERTRAELAGARTTLAASEHDRDRLAERLEAREAELRARAAEVDRREAELERVRSESRQQQERAEQLAEILKEVHRSLFHGNIYELVLRACLTLTGATRGLYLTCPGPGRPLRVRAAAGIDGYPRTPVSPFIESLCRRSLENGGTLVHNEDDPDEHLPEPETLAEEFRNYVVTPVVLLKNLDGIILVADKASGDFQQDDAAILLSVGDQAAVAVENRHLEKELQSAYVSTVSMLADAVEAKDPYTHGHCEMASRYARLVARRMELSDYDEAVVCYAALLHDVGKIGVSDGVLHKPGPLLPEEVELMRAHVRVGHDLLCNVPALRSVADVVLHHHERYDGSGYPDGLSGDDIPVPARIVAVVDAYCAMVTRRSYKEASTDEEARAELRRCAGSQFDPEAVAALLAVLDTPEAADGDEDYNAECGALPGFAHIRELRVAL